MTVKTVLTKPACGSVSPYCEMIALRRAGNTCRSIELNMECREAQRFPPLRHGAVEVPRNRFGRTWSKKRLMNSSALSVIVR
jgi:hypothetical protein